MKYAVAFVIFAAGLTYLAVAHGGWTWLLLWPAASFLIVACGYAGMGARVMGKRGDGSITPWSSVLLLPYRLFALSSWWTQKSLSREPVYAEIAPGIWIGRRAGANELPPGTSLVIDLTSEFREPAAVRSGRHYICVPVLDACACGDDAMVRAAINRIATTTGPVYIHCAQGHGRAGMFAAALFLSRGTARDVDDALAALRSRRPGVRLNRRQRAFLMSFVSHA